MINAPSRYNTLNGVQTKFPAYVLRISDYDILLGTSANIGTYIRYGDAGIRYGDADLIYGGTRRLKNARGWIDLDNSTTRISQVHEQEQGRASVATLQLSIVDYEGEITKLITPGKVINDLLGQSVEFFGGFTQLSFPEEYVRLFRGYVDEIQSMPGRIVISLVDPSAKRKQELFLTAKTKLVAAIGAGDTSIQLVSAQGFHCQITNPNGDIDTTHLVGCQIDDEFIQYSGVSDDTLIGCVRGAWSDHGGGAAAAHDAGADVTALFRMEGIAIDLALKAMLSGWGGPWRTGVAVQSINITGEVTPLAIQDTIRFPVDVRDVYGLTTGDYIFLTGYPGEVFTVAEILDLYTVRVAEQGILLNESASSSTASFRSKYDVYPTTCGLRMSPEDVDVERHEYWEFSFLGSQQMSFLISETESSGKTFIEKELLFPVSAYSLVRSGRVSMGLTHPPLTTEILDIIDDDTVIDPESIVTKRGFNTRRFFNEVLFNYDNEGGDFKSSLRQVDTESLNKFKMTKTLSVDSKGFRSWLSGEVLAQSRARRFLSRYRLGCEEISLNVSWGKGHLHEVGDIIVLNDKGHLQISNSADGTRRIKNVPMEILDRTVGIKDGKVALKLLSRAGFELTDRYAVIGPSSTCRVGGATFFEVQSSFGGRYGSEEWQKWAKFIGYRVRIHRPDYSASAVVIIEAQDSTNKNKFYFAGTHTAHAGDIVELAPYDDTSEDSETLAKNVYVYLNPSINVVSGTSQTAFEVSDASHLRTGAVMLIHSPDWTRVSVEAFIQTIAGTTITVDRALGFTPQNGDMIELVGFLDNGAPYRII